MLMLKMLVLMLIFKKKKKKQYIAYIYYERKLSVFVRDDTRQAKILIFIVVPQAEQVPKVKKREMQIEPSFVK